MGLNYQRSSTFFDISATFMHAVCYIFFAALVFTAALCIAAMVSKGRDIRKLRGELSYEDNRTIWQDVCDMPKDFFLGFKNTLAPDQITYNANYACPPEYFMPPIRGVPPTMPLYGNPYCNQ